MAEIIRFKKSDKNSHREKIALAYTEAIVWNPDLADDALWEQLHAEFTEAQIVEIGYWAGFTSGGQRWLHTLHTRQGELAEAIARKKAAGNE